MLLCFRTTLAALFVVLACARATADTSAPVIFAAPQQARANDILPVVGANFDDSLKVYAGPIGSRSTALTIVNRHDTSNVSVQMPSSMPTGFSFYLENSYGTSQLISPNQSRPMHLDSTYLVPGGRFRLFGQNLKIGTATPVVKFAGVTAALELHNLSSTMLAGTVPPNLPAGTVSVTADNGQGNGPGTLPFAVPVRADDAQGDVLGLGVGWAAAFAPFAGHVVTAYAPCDGTSDAAPAIRSAVAEAIANGGGTVQLPSGTCRLATTIDLGSRVILKGNGQSETTLRYEGNYPIYAFHFDLVGLSDLKLENAGSAQEGVTWQQNTRSFIRNVTFAAGVSRQWFFTANSNFVYNNNIFIQDASYNQQNPYRFDDSCGLVFSNSQSINRDGSPTFQRVHDAVIANNHITRDASSQNESDVIAHHQLVIDFSYRISVLNNTFDLMNGPINNKTRNDGEAILVEGGGSLHNYSNLGVVQSSTASTFTDSATVLDVDPYGTSAIPENYGVAIVAGRGLGQARRIVAYDAAGRTATVDRDWDVNPDSTSHYSTFVWGLSEALISHNYLFDNPRGIWLYQTNVDHVAITHNRFNNGGGVFAKTIQKLAEKQSNFQRALMISDNIIANYTGNWLSYISLAATLNNDAEPFGVGLVAPDVRRNTLLANKPSLISNVEDYAGREGYTVLPRFELSGTPTIDSRVPQIFGAVLQGNTCLNCSPAVLIGSGEFATVAVDNQPSTQPTDQRSFTGADPSVSTYFR